jgi:hypothetical protein
VLVQLLAMPCEFTAATASESNPLDATSLLQRDAHSKRAHLESSEREHARERLGLKRRELLDRHDVSAQDARKSCERPGISATRRHGDDPNG